MIPWSPNGDFIIPRAFAYRDIPVPT
jgi:hypothetical protein